MEKRNQLKKLIISDGWRIGLFTILFVRTCHGLPMGVQFLVPDQSMMQSQHFEYSGRDLWEMQEGVYSLVFLVLLVYAVWDFIRKFRQKLKEDGDGV